MPRKNLNFLTKKDVLEGLRITEEIDILDHLARSKDDLFKVVPMLIGKKERDIHKCHGDLRFFLKRFHRVLSLIPLPDQFYGGIKHRSVRQNAERHSGHKYVMNMDLNKFFPSVRPAHIYGVYKRLGCSDQIAHLLTAITTANNHLPQGFATSPILSAHFLTPMALEIRRKLPKDLDFTFWIDDLTISGNISPARYIPLIKGIAKDYDMKINSKKTHVGKKGVRLRKVTGIIINEEGLSPDIGYIENIEKMIEIMNRHGLEVMNDVFDSDYQSIDHAKSKIISKIRWIGQFKKEKAKVLMQKLNAVQAKRS